MRNNTNKNTLHKLEEYARKKNLTNPQKANELRRRANTIRSFQTPPQTPPTQTNIVAVSNTQKQNQNTQRNNTIQINTSQAIPYNGLYDYGDSVIVDIHPFENFVSNQFFYEHLLSEFPTAQILSWKGLSVPNVDDKYVIGEPTDETYAIFFPDVSATYEGIPFKDYIFYIPESNIQSKAITQQEKPVPSHLRTPMTTNKTNAHLALRLNPGATRNQIRAAYRQRALETHPDKGGSADAFRKVQAAYETLMASQRGGTRKHRRNRRSRTRRNRSRANFSSRR